MIIFKFDENITLADLSANTESVLGTVYCFWQEPYSYDYNFKQLGVDAELYFLKVFAKPTPYEAQRVVNQEIINISKGQEKAL